jgi:hypothetical protein
MNSPKCVFLLPWAAVVLLSSPACINVPDIEPAKAEVRITSPEAVAYTNGVLEVRLAVTGHTPERVELLRNGEVLAEVAAPYTYAWDTSGVAEGTHQLVARAVFGDVVFASEAREVVVDRTAPQVVSRTPEPGAQDVWVKSPIQAVFSEPLKASTVSDASVRLTVGTVEVARTVSLSADGRTVTVVPGEDVVPPKSVAVVFSGEVTDLTGNPLPETATWSWFHPVTRLAPYGPSLPEAEGRTVVYVPALLPDGDGGVIVSRIEQDGTNKYLRIYKQTGTEWIPMGGSLAFRDSYSELDEVTMELDPVHKVPVIAWHEGNGSNESERIYVARWTGSNWDYLGGTAGVTPDSPYSTFPSLALNDAGTPFVALTNDTELTTHVYRWTGNAWSVLGDSLGSALGAITYRAISIETNTSGHPIVAVMARKESTFGLYVVEWTGSEWRPFGGTAEASKPPFDFNSNIASSIQFMLDAQGKPVLSWISGSPEQGKRTFSYILDGDQWKTRCAPFLIAADSTDIGIFQMDTSGVLWLAWSEKDTPTFRFARCNGDTWSSFATSAWLGASYALATLHAFTTTNADPFFAAATLPDGSSVLIRANVAP